MRSYRQTLNDFMRFILRKRINDKVTMSVPISLLFPGECNVLSKNKNSKEQTDQLTVPVKVQKDFLT